MPTADAQDRTPCPALGSSDSVREVDFLLGSPDVSQIKTYDQAMRALAASELRFQTVFGGSPDSIFLKDANSVYTAVNDKFAELPGKTPEELVGLTDFDLFDDETARQILEVDRRVLTGEAIAEEHHMSIDGKSHWFYVVKIPLRDSSNRITGLCGISRDITQRVEAQDALKKSEEQYRGLFDDSMHPIYVSTPAGKFLDMNAAGVELFGYSSREEMLSIDIGRDLFVNKSDREDLLRLLDEHGSVREFEARLKTRGGEELVALVTSTAMRDEQGRIAACRGILRDVTEQRKLEEQLAHAQKIEAVGTLASGIAHDFNNLITAIFGYTDLAKATLPGGHQAIRSLDMVEQAARQASGVTKSLLTFSRKVVSAKTVTDFSKVVSDSVRFLRRLLPASIELVEDIQDEEPIWVNADAVQLQQVLMNLAINARDAMPEGGILRISLSRLVSSHALSDDRSTAPSHSPEMPSSRSAILAVQDNGIGMTEDVRCRVFEPFFTTKPRGGGSGLGMSVIHGIVSDHGGCIHVQSKVDEGTRVTVAFPSCDAPAVEYPVAPPMTRGAGTGLGELVVVAEDNQQVRSIMVSTLRSAGYNAMAVADGQRALELITERRGVVRLAVLDIDLPRMSGLVCLEHVRVDQPDLPVVLVTGNESLDLEEQVGDSAFVLRKPFHMSDLALVVGQMLVRTSRATGMMS